MFELQVSITASAVRNISKDSEGFVDMGIISYISAHWLEWLFMIIASFAAYGYRSVLKKLKEEKARNEAIAEGVQSLLRDSIVSAYNRYQEKGYCPIYAKESVKKIYMAYHNLGGNDVATSLYHKLLAMQEDNGDEDAK